MKRHLLALVLALGLLSSACEGNKQKPDDLDGASARVEPPASVVKESARTKEARLGRGEPILWRVDGEKGPVYILGTIHVGVDLHKQFPKGLWSLVGRSDVFVMETDLSAASGKMLTASLLPQGETLKGELGEEDFAKLDALLDGAGESFNGYKPWFIVSMLLLKMLPDGVTTLSMDKELHAHAVDHGKELGYLEEPSYQLSVLERTMTMDELREMLDDFDAQKEDLADMIEMYTAGDIEGMSKLSFKEMEEKKEHYEILFFERNNNWLPLLEGYIERGKVFVAVGAGHLLGERGVIALLEKKGYAPERVTRSELEEL
ncbi:MAG: TraB/GumN family protein [Myxococcota bacterium]